MQGVYFKTLEDIPFQSSIDPKPDSCFNCWKRGHSREECPKPKCHDFCFNCGRRDVRISNCPRCSRGYVLYWKKARRENKRRGYRGSESHDDAPKLFQMEKTKNVEESTVDQDAEQERHSSNESGYYEDLVVDEEERSLKFTGAFLEDFLNLMNAMKHLPIQTQNTVILRFVEDRRKLINEEGLFTFKIPYQKIWSSCHCVFDYAYKFGSCVVSKFSYFIKQKVQEQLQKHVLHN